MERAIINCNFCGKQLKRGPYKDLYCSHLDCKSFDGMTKVTYFSSFQDLVNETGVPITKTSNATPLTTDDILDIRVWSKQVKYHELHYLTRAKTKA